MCSGIEAVSVAWGALGFEPVAFSEIDPFPCAVLQYHYPDVPNWGDLTRFEEWPDACRCDAAVESSGPRRVDHAPCGQSASDWRCAGARSSGHRVAGDADVKCGRCGGTVVHVLVGGTPCQSFSVVGLRAGLADPRGNLALVYLAVLARYRPRWCVWENVPGVLSADDGRALGAFVGGLGHLGYGWAYRVLDAQYWGLAQRRKRLFVVGCLGDWRRAVAVLFERAETRGKSLPPSLHAALAGVASGPTGTATEDWSPEPSAPSGPKASEARTATSATTW